MKHRKRASTSPITAKKPITTDELFFSVMRGRLDRPRFFLCGKLLQQDEKLGPFAGVEPSGDAALVKLDAALKPGEQRAPRTGEPKPVGAPVLTLPALDQAPLL